MSIQKLKEVPSYSDVSGVDEFAENQRLSQAKTDYQKSLQALSAVSYLDRLKPIFRKAKLFKAFYHVLSPVLGIVTAYLLAEQFLGLNLTSPLFVIAIAFVMGAILVFVLFWLEDTKKHLLTEIYKAISNENNPEKSQIFSLRLIVFFSILTSAVGGACISYKITDNTQTIVKDYKSEKDSLGRYYVTEIGALRNQIKNIEDIRKSPARLPWGGGLTPDETQSLQVYQKRLGRLEKERDAQIGTLKKEQTASMSVNMSSVWSAVGVTASLVILFELLLIYCYKFEYIDYHKRIRHEALSYGIVGSNAGSLNVNVNTNAQRAMAFKTTISPETFVASHKEKVTYEDIKHFGENLAETLEKKLTEIKNETEQKNDRVGVEDLKGVNEDLNKVQIGFTHLNPVNKGVNEGVNGVNIDLDSKITFEAFKDLPAKQQKVVPHLKDYYAKLNTKNSITLEIVAEKSGVSLSTVHNVKRIVEQNMSVKTTVKQV